MNSSFNLILAVLLLGFNNGSFQTDWDRLNLKGAVATIKVMTFSSSSDSLNSNHIFSNHTSVTNYDIAGYKVSIFNYDESGNIEKWWEYSRDSLGLRFSEICFLSDSTLESTKVRHYNDSGRLIETQTYSAEGALLEKWLNEFDQTEWHECTSEQYSPKGKLQETWYYARSQSHDTLIMQLTNRKGKLTDSFIEFYDTNGNIYERTRYVPSNLAERFTIVYDSSKSIQQVLRHVPKSDIIYRSTFTYTQFDSSKNWTERFVTYDNNIQYFERREITYFR